MEKWPLYAPGLQSQIPFLINMIADLDAWVEKLRQKIPLEENELELLCRIVKDLLMQEPNVIVTPFCLAHDCSPFPLP